MDQADGGREEWAESQQGNGIVGSRVAGGFYAAWLPELILYWLVKKGQTCI